MAFTTHVDAQGDERDERDTTSAKIDFAGVAVPENVDDKYFARYEY